MNVSLFLCKFLVVHHRLKVNKAIDTERISMVINPEEDYLEKISNLIRSITERSELDIKIADIIEVSIAEACHNAVRHGKQGQTPVGLEVFINHDQIKAVITNAGKEISFDDTEAFDVEQNFLDYRSGGLGIPLIKKLMDSVIYERRDDNVNKLTLIKLLKKEPKK